MDSIRRSLCPPGETQLSRPRCAALFVATVTLSWVALRKFLRKRIDRFRCVPGLPFLGVAPYISVAGFTEQQEAWAKEYGGEGAFEYNVMGERLVVLCSWEAMEPVLLQRPFKVTKPEMYGHLGDINSGIFFSEGEQWKRERRLMAPAFNAKNVQQYAPAVCESVGDLLTALERENNQKGEANFSRLLVRFTSEVITKVAWGYEEHGLLQDDSKLIDDISLTLDAVGTRFFSPFPYWKVPGLANLIDGGDAAQVRLDKRLATVTDAVADQGQTTVVEKLRKAEGDRLTHGELKGNMRVLLLAGSDTSSQALSWTFYYLACMPELQSQVAAEVCALKEVPMNPEQLDMLPLVKAVWMETLRLKGPAPFDQFTTQEPVTVAGRQLPAQSEVLALYRHVLKTSSRVAAVLGDDLEEFRPSRWLGPEGVVKLAPFDTLAFGHGARICLGMRLADFEGRVVIARVVQRFRLKAWQGPPMTEKTTFVLKPACDVKISLEPRT